METFYDSFEITMNLKPPELCTAIMNLSWFSVVFSLFAQTIASVTRFPRVDSSLTTVGFLAVFNQVPGVM